MKKVNLMGKLDPKLTFISSQSKIQPSRGVHKEILENQMVIQKPDAFISLLVNFTGTVDDLKSSGVTVTSVAGDIAAIRIKSEEIPNLERNPNIKYAALENVSYLESGDDVFDDVLSEVNAHEVHKNSLKLTGRGVIIGIIDTGINYFHNCFIDGMGESRILSIWDQNLKPETNEMSPSAYGYGVEYKQLQINSALKKPPELKLRHNFSHPHGTNVAAIAAGSGRVNLRNEMRNYTGMAPDAEIIMVAYPKDEIIGSSAKILDALTYILGQASTLDQPVVINFSSGDNLGAHDGTSLLERAIDNLLDKSGRAFVKSAGNSARAKKHASGVLNNEEIVSFKIDSGTKSEVNMDLWYESPDRFSIKVQSPGGETSKSIAPGNGPEIFQLDGSQIFVDSRLNNPFNKNNHIFIKIQVDKITETISEGEWKLHLAGDNISDGRFNIWIESNFSGTKFNSHVDDKSTVTIPGTAKKSITVGSYICDKKENCGKISPDSALGPTLDGRNKPDILAPGEGIFSASNSASNDGCRRVFGTSMAAPVITGAIACMLQHNPNLTQDRISTHLIASARSNKLDLKGCIEGL